MDRLWSVGGAAWGVGGIVLLLTSAIYRLGRMAFDAFEYAFDWRHWALLIGFFLFMTISEGYQGFQKGFSPRVAARARYLANHPNPVHAIFAPFFCMGFFYATRKRKLTSFIITSGIISLVIIVSYVPQPWRGIIDFGVAAGLIWGLVALVLFTVSAFTSESFTYPTDVPDQT